MKCRYFLCCLLFLILLTNCAGVETKETKPSLGKYLVVDSWRLTTTLFMGDYSGKYVKTECLFVMPANLPPGYSDTKYFAFQVKDPKNHYATDFLTVIGPKSLSGVLLSLSPDNRITVFGRGIELTLKNMGGAKYTQLALEADSIEK